MGRISVPAALAHRCGGRSLTGACSLFCSDVHLLLFAATVSLRLLLLWEFLVVMPGAWCFLLLLYLPLTRSLRNFFLLLYLLLYLLPAFLAPRAYEQEGGGRKTSSAC